MAARVRSGEITPPELSGATFTVSNLGMYGMSAIYPVINVPQAAILGVGATRPVPALDNGALIERELAGIAAGVSQILHGPAPAERGGRLPQVMHVVLKSYGGRHRAHRLLMEHSLARGTGARLNPFYRTLIESFSTRALRGAAGDTAVLSEADAFVLGRGMFDNGYEAYWDAALADTETASVIFGREPYPREVDYAQLAHATPHIVLSKTMAQAAWPNVRIARDVADVAVLIVLELT